LSGRIFVGLILAVLPWFALACQDHARTAALQVQLDSLRTANDSLDTVLKSFIGDGEHDYYWYRVAMKAQEDGYESSMMVS